MTRNPFQWDWTDAVFINEDITDKLISSIAPRILSLKQRGIDIITVGIDSRGGSIDSATRLLSLLRSPGPNGQTGTVVTVAINKAFSAAACLLALGDYAVALPSAQIHYHDVRFSTIVDLTSSRAVEAARELQRENDKMALLLADSVVKRLTWVFMGLQNSFDQAKKDFPALVEKVVALEIEDMLTPGGPHLDFAGFVCGQYAHTSPQGDSLIRGALDKLQGWRGLEIAVTEFREANDPEKSDVALFRDDNPLITVTNANVPPEQKFTWASRQGLRNDLVLMLLLLVRKATSKPLLRLNDMTMSDLMAEYAFVKEIRRQKHVDSAMNLMLENDYILFDDFVGEKIKDAKTAEDRAKLLGAIFPQVQTFWVYVVLMCRSLFDGEHPISLDDALFLGLIDEIAGRDVPKTMRQVRDQMNAREMAKEGGLTTTRKWPKPNRKT